MVMRPAGLGLENDCGGEDQQQLQMTDPSSRQRKRPTSTNLQPPDSNKNLVLGPKWGYTPRQTGLRVVGRYETLTWTLSVFNRRAYTERPTPPFPLLSTYMSRLKNVKLSLEDVWNSGCINPRFLDFGSS
jgi:hypothetical protein